MDTEYYKALGKHGYKVGAGQYHSLWGSGHCAAPCIGQVLCMEPGQCQHLQLSTSLYITLEMRKAGTLLFFHPWDKLLLLAVTAAARGGGRGLLLQGLSADGRPAFQKGLHTSARRYTSRCITHNLYNIDCGSQETSSALTCRPAALTVQLRSLRAKTARTVHVTPSA